jgi:hypothetical protein
MSSYANCLRFTGWSVLPNRCTEWGRDAANLLENLLDLGYIDDKLPGAGPTWFTVANFQAMGNMLFFMPLKDQANFLTFPVDWRFNRGGGRQNSPRLIEFSQDVPGENFSPWAG